MPFQEALSYKQKNAIVELHMRMENSLTAVMRDDESLYYRFLKAQDFDVDKAEKMLRKHIIWRKVNQIDTILEDFKPTEVFRKCLDASFVGFDKDGNAIRYGPLGKIDPQDILKCMTISYQLKHWLWICEKTISLLGKENIKTGKYAYRATLIIDLDKVTLAVVTSRLAAELVIQIVNVIQDNYPERLKRVLVINAPSFFVIFFSMLKTVMSNAMQKKFCIFGNSGWKEALLEVIDADTLPAFLGGNRTDPDGNPLCQTFINHGGKFPEHYYLTQHERYFKDISEVKKVVVHPSEREDICIEVKHVGSLLQWEFLVKGKDIGFGIFFGESMTEVIPIEKYTTADGKEKDSYKCRTNTGKYIIVFDNSYSWMTSKEVQYCITVVEPK